MATYIDVKGTNLEAILTVNVMRKIERQKELNGGFDPVKLIIPPETSEQVEILCADPRHLGAVIWCLVEKDANLKTISESDFDETFIGPALESAVNAIIEATADFFQNPRSASLRAMIKKAEQVGPELEKLDQATAKAISELDAGSIALQTVSGSATKSEDGSR